MPLHLRSAVEDDCPAIGLITTRAFRNGLSGVYFPPHLKALTTEDEEVPWRVARALKRMRQGLESVVAVDLVDGSEIVVGFAQWEAPLPPGQADREIVPSPENDGLVSLDRDALDRLVKDQEYATRVALGPDRHRYMWCTCFISGRNQWPESTDLLT